MSINDYRVRTNPPTRQRNSTGKIGWKYRCESCGRVHTIVYNKKGSMTRYEQVPHSGFACVSEECGGHMRFVSTGRKK